MAKQATSTTKPGWPLSLRPAWWRSERHCWCGLLSKRGHRSGVLRQHTANARANASSVGPGDAQLERAARVVEETYGHLIEGSPARGQAAAGANPRDPPLSVTPARQASSLQPASGQVPPGVRAQGPPHPARARGPAATGVAQAPPAALRSQWRSGAAHAQLPSAADGHGPPPAAHAQAQTRVARVQVPAMTPCGQGLPPTVCAQESSSTARAGLNRERRASHPTRCMLACTESPMTTPPRRISTSTALCTTSPHVRDESADSSDDATASDGTLQLDGASVHSAEAASGSDIGKLHPKLHLVLHLMLHLMLHSTLHLMRYHLGCKLSINILMHTWLLRHTFCGECSQQGPIFLCMKPRCMMRGVAMTCWDVWHVSGCMASSFP